jgi:pseudo-rSAM protein
MIQENNKYWIFIEPTTYGCNKGGGWLLYNTMNGAHYTSKEAEVLTVLNELYNWKNLGVTLISGKAILENAALLKFVEEMQEKKLGGISSVTDTKSKPIRLLPLLNFQKDVDKLKLNKVNSSGKDVAKYLLELNLYLNNVCNQSCALCNVYNKQHTCCSANSDINEYFSPQQLERVVNQIASTNITTLNILGGDILLHPEIEQIANILQRVKSICQIWMNYKNVSYTSLFEGFTYTVTIAFPIEKLCIHNAIKNLNVLNTLYLFFITSEDDYEKAISVVNAYPEIRYKIFPIFEGNNLDFFQKVVFVNEEDILENSIPLRKIFAHQKMNTNFFGSLTILPNGEVKANINTKAIGNVKENSLLELVHTELLENTSWRRIRDSEPCTQCNLQYLCPSPSNLEIAIGRPNLCNK